MTLRLYEQARIVAGPFSPVYQHERFGHSPLIATPRRTKGWLGKIGTVAGYEKAEVRMISHCLIRASFLEQGSKERPTAESPSLPLIAVSSTLVLGSLQWKLAIWNSPASAIYGLMP